MAKIFPGMDPYLEDPQIWPGVHARLVIYISDHLQPQLRPRYVAAVEERVYVEGPDRELIPDASVRRTRDGTGLGSIAVLEADAPVLVKVPELEVHEPYVTILDLHSNQRIVAVIEVLSPTNKHPGPGQKSYLAKQREVLSSETHLVEIDLLRTGQHVAAVPEWIARGKGPYDSLVSTNRAAGLRDCFELYPRRLQERLPRVRIPLAEGDRDVVLDVQAVLAQTYDAGSYADRLDYAQPCRPALSAEDQTWAEEQIRAARAVQPPS
jgi:hypothetical protein